MAGPFVISAKFTLDGSSVTASAGDIRQEFAKLDTVLDTSARKAVELQTALEARSTASGNVGAYQETLQQIRIEQQLESQRLGAQITEKGRNESVSRLAVLARDAAAASSALATAETEAAQAAQRVETAAGGAAVAVARLADQQQRVASVQASSINTNLGVRDDFGSISRGADIEAYGRALDDMRAQYNPLFAAEQRHEAQLASIRRAHQLGAISSFEMGQAITREGTAYSQAISAINGNTEAVQRNVAMRSARPGGDGSFATANIAAQFQDIAVTSAMGMSPLQIALQQGTQISAAFENMGAAGAVRTLGSAFLSIISPVSLVTIGLVAGAAAAIQFFSGLSEEAETASEALDRHNDELDALLVGYDKARAAAQGAFDAAIKQPQGVVASDLRATLKEQEEAQAKVQLSIQANRDALAETVVFLRQLQDAGTAGGEDASSLDAPIRQIELMRQLAIDTGSSREELEAATVAAREFYNTTDEDSLKEMADQAYQLAVELLGIQAQADSASAALQAMPDNILVTIGVQMEGFNEARSSLLDLMPDFRSSYDRARDEANEAYTGMRDAATDGVLRQQAASDYQTVLEGIDRQEAEAEAKRTARSAKSAGAEVSAYDRLIKSTRERTAAQQSETNVIGLGTYATERARMVLELENAAKEDSVGLSATRSAQIQEEASAYASAAAAQERSVEAQRQANEQMEFNRSTFRSFFADLKSGLQDGQDGWSALGNAGANALDRIADRALGMAADGIFDMIFGAVISGITGGFGGSPAGLGAGGPGFLGGGASTWGSWASGGETGSGDPSQVAGLVHRNEFVVRSGPAQQHRGLLERLNAGGSATGQAGAGVTLAPSYNFNGSGFTEAQARRLMADNNRDLMSMMPEVLSDARLRAVRGT